MGSYFGSQSSEIEEVRSISGNALDGMLCGVREACHSGVLDEPEDVTMAYGQSDGSALSHEQEKANRRIRIERLKKEAEELSGGEMLAWDNGRDEDAELVEKFWQRVVAFEKNAAHDKGSTDLGPPRSRIRRPERESV